MFERLVASRPQAQLAAHRYVLSVTLHSALVAGAVALTRHPVGAAHLRPPEPAMLYLAPRPERPAAPVVDPHSPARSQPRAPALPPRVEVPDIRLPTLPADVPTVADIISGAKDPADAAQRLPAFGVGAGTSEPGAPLTAQVVDEPVVVVKQPAPRYPPGLAQAGITGRVELEYVVDTTGRAEERSLRTLTATHPAFDAAARASVLASRYRPARLGGRTVRQLVRQTLAFSLRN